jgi:Ribonuclease G/E
MTLFDVDGDGDPAALALTAAGATARAIQRMGIGGSIGVDFPTLANKAERNAVAEALDAALPQPFERTAVNGYGFLQIIRPRRRASLPELLAANPVGAEARALLRRIERTPPPGVTVERVRPALLAALKPEWIAELHRRTGTPTRFEAS